MAPEGIAAIAAFLLLMALLALGSVMALKANKAGEAEASGGAGGADTDARARATGRGRMGRNLRQRPNRRAAEVAVAEPIDGDEEDEDEPPDYSGMTRAERRAAQREERRTEREEMRQAERDALDAKDAKRKAYDDRRRQKEEEREAAEAAAMEELRRAEEERLRREEEEASKWLHLIAVEGEGQDAEEDGEAGQGLLQQFIDYIKGAKAVELDELASEFRLPTSEVIQRITQLEEQGTLTGVMDDRGKFIYISLEEMAAVAQFMTARGRVSIAELAAKSNTFIDLDSKVVERSGEQPLDLDLDLDLEE